MATLSARLGKCEVCACKDAKYTCPKCEVKTCCIACANIHKKELSCSGVRDKVNFKQLSKFTNMDLQSDYMLLEEMTRNVEKYSRDPLKGHGRNEKDIPHVHPLALPSQEFLPTQGQHHVLGLEDITSSGGGWSGSSHKETTSSVLMKGERTASVLMKGERTASVLMKDKRIASVDERLGENVRIGSHVNKYLDPAVCDLSLREHLQFYQSAGLSGVHLMLKAEKVPKAGVWYYELDPALTLKENLAGKCVIEFPTVYVVLEHHKHLFETLDSDEEFEEYDVMSREFPNKFNGTGQRGFTRTNRNGVVNRGINKTNNFLFNHSDNSDSSDTEQNVKKPKLDIPPYHVLIKQHMS
uniref:HIT-type domain-containing protein n=1 Tax=Timema cristinae TaxID=61476 RepID=A0A7R9D1Z6_TIMCR|nr:unnamed protein product [Timema cristinae]